MERSCPTEGLGQSRTFFMDSLIAMGARIVLCDPHRAAVDRESLSPR
jgi:hypothetical protein